MEGETLSSRRATWRLAGTLALQEKGDFEMRTKTVLFALATGTLLAAGLAGATDPVSAVSVEAVALDTRGLSRVTAVEEDDLDTRSYTVDWSEVHKLNTNKIMGTILLLN